MVSSGKMQAGSPEELEREEGAVTASELATDDERAIDPFIGLGIRRKRKITLLRVSEVTENDYLLAKDFIDSHSNSAVEQWFNRNMKRRRNTRLSILLGSALGMGGALFWDLNHTGGFNLLFWLNMALYLVSGCSFLFMALIMMGGDRKEMDDLFMREMSPGRLSISRGFTKVDGSYFDLNTPNYEELYEAFTLLRKVDSALERRTEALEKLRDLKKARKDKETVQLIEELNREADECGKLIDENEPRIAELLASDGMGNREEV